MLDFRADNIQQLIAREGWREQGEQAVKAVYEFVRDRILFGYNPSGDMTPASQVLIDGIGQCNTKATLLMALYRALGIECRFHGGAIDKALQAGALPRLLYQLAPRTIRHSWVDVVYRGRWVALEGVILDKAYLEMVQKQFKECRHPFFGYGIATENLDRPNIDWTGRSTFIQRLGVTHDDGVFNSPDDFYLMHRSNDVGLRGWLFRNFFVSLANRNVQLIRSGQTMRMRSHLIQPPSGCTRPSA
jgi:hypothetical protein